MLRSIVYMNADCMDSEATLQDLASEVYAILWFRRYTTNASLCLPLHLGFDLPTGNPSGKPCQFPYRPAGEGEGGDEEQHPKSSKNQGTAQHCH